MKITKITVLALFLCQIVFAQDKALRNCEFSWTMGFAEMDIATLPDGANGDFLNYFVSDPGYLDYVVMKLGFRFDFMEKMSADVNLILFDDIIPDDFDVAVYYNPLPKFGVGFGAMLYKNWIESYEDLYIQDKTDYYWLDGASRAFTFYDFAVYFSPLVRPFYNDKFKVVLKCNIGLSTFLREGASFSLKQKYSNERQTCTIKTCCNFQPFVNPSVDLRLKLFDMEKTSLGLVVKSSLFYGKRSIDYNRTVQTWSANNVFREKVKMEKHDFGRYEFSGGVYISW